MLITKRILVSIAFAALSNSTLAQSNKLTLNELREQVVKQYVKDLQTADYKDIVQLFDKTGYVVSTSRGKVDAKEFYYGFLPLIESASTELHQVFFDNNRMSARFNFAFKLKDGEVGRGEYVDEFIFASHSAKLTAVYMFENLKFEA